MSVVIRKVKTALQTEYRKAGGIRVDEAIAQADQNLETLSAQCAERIDAAIAEIIVMTADPHRQPTAGELRTLHALLNEMLACCATIEIEGLVDTLYALGRLVGALMATDTWLDGALTPAVNLLRLVRRGAIAPEDVKALVAGIDQCAHRINTHTRLNGYR